nr:CpaF family protein [Thermaerobacter sp.]
MSLKTRLGGRSQGAGLRTVASSPSEEKRQAPGADYLKPKFLALKARVQESLMQRVQNPEKLDREELRQVISEIMENEKDLPPLERDAVSRVLSDEITGYGPIQPLLDDPAVSEIMINGPNHVYIERAGRLELTQVVFRDANHLKATIEKMLLYTGRRVDESSPMVDARLPDGSRLNAVVHPIAVTGDSVTIRKFSKNPFSLANLTDMGALSAQMAEFLEAAVKGRFNIIVSGGTGSGKTTLLNALSAFIPEHDRIVTIEDAAELQLQQEHKVTLEARPPNVEGTGAIPIRALVRNALRMRPDRIIVGEVRGGEALDMLQAMNTGHEGSLTTAHANTPRDCLSRIETMVLMAGAEL